ncbi:hypothetical protein [Persicitalea jodogahamensis]|uniref:Uncharacterized protein n=1 Tax=Persicitalea jodogahamensis TaxID=402147 RepID=A0A8J3GCS5_9BACT|nr:hypothetical protein [Persicitalea jodogahamensis]GHB86572.1 hypothetical protein GCM10007390_47710 [Persicitalea jodogahamensis]
MLLNEGVAPPNGTIFETGLVRFIGIVNLLNLRFAEAAIFCMSRKNAESTTFGMFKKLFELVLKSGQGAYIG